MPPLLSVLEIPYALVEIVPDLVRYNVIATTFLISLLPKLNTMTHNLHLETKRSGENGAKEDVIPSKQKAERIAKLAMSPPL